MQNCYQYAGADTGELSMVFSFHHLKVDFVGNEKWVLVPFDFQKLKDILFSWQTGMSEHNAWNAVFWCNHDQPRVVSRFGDEGEYWKPSAKMLGTVIHCLRGTPYIYQGEEIGMTNPGFTSLDQYRDVESINHYHILRDRGLHEDSAYDILRVHSRDNSRTPMQWDGSETGGFSAAVPWIEMNPNHTAINAASQIDDPDSVFAHYQKLIALRKAYPVFVEGDFTLLCPQDGQVFAYLRRGAGQELLAAVNLSGRPAAFALPADFAGASLLLATQGAPAPGVLRPWEALLYLRSL